MCVRCHGTINKVLTTIAGVKVCRLLAMPRRSRVDASASLNGNPEPDHVPKGRGGSEDEEAWLRKRSVCVYVNENNVEEEEEQVSMTVPRTVPTVCHCQSTKDNDIKDIKTGTRQYAG